eukprot:scaffold82566_cov63-Attheya_sp.AAC.4
MQEYNNLSDDMQIGSIIVKEVELRREFMSEQADEGHHLRRNLARRSFIVHFRGLSLCIRCPSKWIRDPLFESRTKRGHRLHEDVTIPSDDEDLSLKFLESFSMNLTNLFANVTDVQILPCVIDAKMPSINVQTLASSIGRLTKSSSRSSSSVSHCPTALYDSLKVGTILVHGGEEMVVHGRLVKGFVSGQDELKAICYLVIQGLEWNERFTSFVQSKFQCHRYIGQFIQ